MTLLKAPGGGRAAGDELEVDMEAPPEHQPDVGARASASLAQRLVWARYRNELLALAGCVAATQLFPGQLLLGVYVQGGIEAAPLALNAIAIVLVFRANKFINFAQLALASVVGVLFTALVQGQLFLNIARSACGCVSPEPGRLPRNINFVLAAVVCIGLAALISWGGYVSVLQRFKKSPRIMLTLVTVFAGQALLGFERQIEQVLLPNQNTSPEAYAAATQRSTLPPGNFTWQIDNVSMLRLGDLVLLVAAAAAIVGLAVFFRKSNTGVAIRAAAENPHRAQMVGVDVRAVTSRVWVFAGMVAGVVGVVSSFGASATQQTDATTTISAVTLAMLLAVAVVARFESVVMTAVAAVVFSILRVAVQFAFASTAPLDAGLVFLIGGLLLLQRADYSRVAREDTSGDEVTKEVRPIPKELRGLPQVKTWVRSGIVVGAIVVFGLPWALASAATTLVTIYVIYAIIGLSLLVLTGWAGQISLGQFGFAAIGAWAAAASGLPFPFALALAMVVGAVSSVVVGVPALKLRGLNLAISTLAFAVSARALFIDQRYLGKLMPAEVERPSVIGMKFDDARVFYYFCVLVFAACCLAVIGLRRSRLGRVLIGIRSNEAATTSFGVNPLRARLTAFAVAGSLAALAGALFAFHQRDITPEQYSADLSIEMFMFSVVGGLGGIAGPIMGFAYMAVLALFDANPLVRYTAAGTGALLLLMMSPGGLAQLAYDIRDGALRRLAIRLRIPVPSLLGPNAALHEFDRAPLDEKRGITLRRDRATLVYSLEHQWALDRYGAPDGDGAAVGQSGGVRG